jgi:hypothetical protein
MVGACLGGGLDLFIGSDIQAVNPIMVALPLYKEYGLWQPLIGSLPLRQWAPH